MGQTATYKEYNVLSDYLNLVDRVAELPMEVRESCKAALLSCDFNTIFKSLKEKCIAEGRSEVFMQVLEYTFPEKFVIEFAKSYAEGYAIGLAEARLERARNLKKNKVDINIIDKNTGLDPEEIASL